MAKSFPGPEDLEVMRQSTNSLIAAVTELKQMMNASNIALMNTISDLDRVKQMRNENYERLNKLDYGYAQMGQQIQTLRTAVSTLGTSVKAVITALDIADRAKAGST